MSVDFGEHDAAEPRVLEEAVGAAVAAHGDMADRVDPQPRLQPRRDGEVEQVDVVGHVGEDRRKLGGQQVEPHAARLAQLDDDVVAVGGRVLHVADRVGKTPSGADRLHGLAGVAHRTGPWLRNG